METVLNGLSVTQRQFEIGDPSSISFARRGINEVAYNVGFNDTVLGKLAIIVTECATNQIKHAQRGELLVRSIVRESESGSPRPVRYGVELLAIDNGPGILDLHACFVDGYTTAGSPGNGMGAIQRLSDELDIWSAPGRGTAMRIVTWAEEADASVPENPSPIVYGAINLPLRGETLCGDAWTCGYADGEFQVLVVDGLGHGPLANTAALAATETFARRGGASVTEIVAASHEALRPTRGAALGVASIPAPEAGEDAGGSARFCGVGNIAASVWTSSSHRHLVSHAGIVGHQMRKTQEFQVDWPHDGILILHSDGLATRWDLGHYPGLAQRHPALIAAVLYRDFTRGRDDVTVFAARAAQRGRMMAESLQVLPLDSELSVVAARRRARELSEALAFTKHDQIRIATSVLEVARVVFLATSGGRAEFLLERADQPPGLLIRLVAPSTSVAKLLERPAGAEHTDSGEVPGPLGVLAAQRLMDACSIDDVAGDAIVTLVKHLSAQAPLAVDKGAAVLAQQTVTPGAGGSFDEMQWQSRELAAALDELQERQEELTRLTRELEDTNRGVVALYAELDERADHLRRADDAKSRFLSNMSHEFRSPLYSIRALSKLLMDRTDGELTDEQAKQVRFIRKAAEDLSETVDDLLDLAKIEAGKVELRPAEFEVANLFSALRGMLRPLLPTADVELVFEPCDEIPPVYTDEGKVSQILRNFVSNALKFTEHGEVRVRAQYDADQQLLTFAVSDTGIGIAPEHQQSIFEEFEQVENRLQTYVKGTGLGLPLCSKLCKLLGGTVGVVSEFGNGSTFTATIQAYLPQIAGQESRPPLASDADTGRDMVLFVSTSLNDRLRYEASLHNTRYRSATAATVREARSTLAMTAACAVLIDMESGREDGWSWLGELREQDSLLSRVEGVVRAASESRKRHVPVIVLSDVDQRGRAESLGADAFFIKPLSGNELLTSLDAMLSAP